MTVAQVKLSDATALLGAFYAPKSATWAEEIRMDAKKRFQEMGAPAKRDEYWRYSNPAELICVPAKTAIPFSSNDLAMFDAVDCLKIVFVDGVYDVDQSDDLTADGIIIESLDAVLKVNNHWVKDLFGQLETRGQTPVERPLAALNTAMASQGIVIRVTKKISKPIAMNYIHKSEKSDTMVHHLIKLESGAELTFLESGAGSARFNTVLEVDIADNAKLHHIRTQGRDHNRKTITHIFARLGSECEFRSFSMTMNGIMTRNEAVIEFLGDNSTATIGGTSVGDGDDFHHDDTIFITHDAKNCESRQVYKKVLRNGATGVFQGKILVKPGAQKTDGYQISQGLLLDDDSIFLAKPELEIYADDVICSHGSTVGALNEDAMFYLMSRGIPHLQAQDLLVLSFLSEAIDEISSEELRAEIRSRLEAWMERRHS